MCAEKFAKVLLIIINVGFFIAGAAVLSLGIIAYVDEDLLFDITSLVTDKLSNVFSQLDILANIDLNGLIKDNAIIIIVIGAIVFGIGFFGCCGAMRKSSCLLQAYAIIVLVILAVQVGLGVYAYMFSSNLEDRIKDGLLLSMAKTYTKGLRFLGPDYKALELPTSGPELAWDSIQLETLCCGVSGPGDWLEAPTWDREYRYDAVTYTDVKLPPACCARTTAGSAKSEISILTGSDFTNVAGCLQKSAGTFNSVGCYDRLREIVFDNQNVIIAVFVIIVIIEILGIICACYLKNKSK